MAASLLPASTHRQASYVEALREGFRRGDQPAMNAAKIDRIDADFAAFVAELTKKDGDIVAPDGKIYKRVPGDIFWLVKGDSFIGEASLRYQLNDFLLKIGGHAGYGIRPRFQRQGYGKLILKQSLAKLRDRGVERALVTCYDHNIGSAKIIEANGGMLENVIEDPRGGGKSRRYWIDL